MPLIKPVTSPSQVLLEYHRILRLDADFANNPGIIMATVGSWVDEAAAQALDGKSPTWVSYVPINVQDVDPSLMNLLDDALAITGDFTGSTTVPDTIMTLDGAKLRKLTYFKNYARRLDQDPITLQGYVFLADDDTRALMFQKVILMREAVADGQSYTVTWELDDGTALTLTPNQLKAVVRAIDTRADNLRATVRSLRTQIQACTTIAEVDAVTWP